MGSLRRSCAKVREQRELQVGVVRRVDQKWRRGLFPNYFGNIVINVAK